MGWGTLLPLKATQHNAMGTMFVLMDLGDTHLHHHLMAAVILTEELVVEGPVFNLPKTG